MAISKNRIDQFLPAARITIENSFDPCVQPMLANYGFDQPKLLDLRVLYEEVADLQATLFNKIGERVGATAQVTALWKQANEMYIRTLNIARIALKKNPELGRMLLLHGKRKRSLSGWLEQARIFYTNILHQPELMALMAQFGYTRERIQDEFLVYTRLADQSARQKIKIAEAQAATKNRNQKLNELASNISDLRAVAKIALKDDPQQLEKLGILARSEGSRPRRKKKAQGD